MSFMEKPFEALVTSARTTGQTVLDKDGRLKMALHNLVPNTDLSDTGDWARNYLFSLSESGVSPSGKPAYLMIDSTANNVHGTSDVLNFVTGTTYSFVLDVKTSGRNFSIQLPSGQFGAAVRWNFDLTGVTATQAVSGLNDSGTISLLSDGWYRCVLTVEATATGGGTANLRMLDGTSFTYAGDETSGVYLSRPRVYQSAVHGGGGTDGMQLATDGTDFLETTNGPVYHLGRAYDGNGVCLGSQHFEGRTNLATFSNDFAGGWTPLNCTILAAGTLSPEGVVNAARLRSDAAGGSDIHKSITGAAGTYCWSIHVREELTPFVRLGIYDTSGGWAVLADGDIANQISPDDMVFHPASAGFVRVSVVGTVTNANPSAYLYLTSDIDGTAAIGAEGIYIYGAQLEAGSFPTPYIPTLASAVARGADDASLLTSSFGYRADEGSVLVTFAPAGKLISESVFSIDDGTDLNRIQVYMSGASDLRSAVSVAGTLQVDIDTLVNPAVNVESKISSAYKGNDFATSADGLVVAIDIIGEMPPVSVFRLGSRTASAGFLNGYIKSIAYYPIRFADANLESESA